MKPWLLLAILPVTGCAGACASAPVIAAKALPTPAPPDMRGVLQLHGRFATASACPVSPTLALSNAHVADPRPFDPGVKLLPYRWSDGDGHGGTVEPVAAGREADLAAYSPTDGEFVHFYAVAKGVPEPGTVLWMQGYDWRNARQAFAPRVQSARVLRVTAGHVILDRPGWPGASGTCWLNAAAEVVAVHMGTAEMDNGQRVAVAVGVWK